MAEDVREIAQRRVEMKRRRRELIAVAVAAITLVAFVFAQTALPPLTKHTSLGSNLAVISLFNISFLLLGLLLYLVGRNLAKVMFERRRGLIGSKFQMRLVFGFIAVAMVPSAFLLYVSGAFLHADVDSWFKPEYERVMSDSLEIAKTYYLNSANNAAHFARAIAEQAAGNSLPRAGTPFRSEAVRRETSAGVQPRHHRGVREGSQAPAAIAEPEDTDRNRSLTGFRDAGADAQGAGDDAY